MAGTIACVSQSGQHIFEPFDVTISIDPSRLEIAIDLRGGTARLYPAKQVAQEIRIVCQMCGLSYTLLAAQLHAPNGLEFRLNEREDGARMRVAKPIDTAGLPRA